MKKIILLLFLLLTNLLSAASPEQVVKLAIDKALKTNYISFNLIDKLKFVESDKFVTDTLYIIAKRNGFVPVINAMVRVQYQNGNVNTFNGKEIKMLDVDERTLFVADTSEDALNYIMGIGINFYIMKHLASSRNKPEFNNYSYKFLKDTTLDKQDCYQVEIYAGDNLKSNSSDEYKIVRDSAVLSISKSDNLIRRYYRAVTLKDGREQIEDQLFSNIETGLPIDDLMFDISLPNGFKLITPKDQKSKDEGLLPIGSDAPKWVLGDENGKEYRLSQYKGKVVVLDFWGTWCKWCKKAMPKIQEIYKEFKDKDVAVFGISCQEPPNTNPAEYMKKVGAEYQLLVQGDEVANHYKIKGYPTLYIVDKNGKIAFRFVGYSDKMKEKLEEVINKELAR